MNAEIHAALDSVEREHNVRIIHACESGSRAWGFPSHDSDYDVRFIYVHPVDHYLQLRERRDVIEMPISGLLDVNGWDIRKALSLALKPNASVIEWLNSPVIYLNTPWADDMADFVEASTVPARLASHYRGILKRTWHESIERADAVTDKKYLYAIRSALALKHIREVGTLPPVRIQGLFALAGRARPYLAQMIADKADRAEKAPGARVPMFDALLREAMDWQQGDDVPGASPAEWDGGDRLFRRIVQHLNVVPGKPCRYCEQGVLTGLPGNACENCMNTGVEH